MDGLTTLFQQLLGQIINVPLENALSVIYVILNFLLELFGISLESQ